jgi:hypothetical protein
MHGRCQASLEIILSPWNELGPTSEALVPDVPVQDRTAKRVPIDQGFRLRY